MIIDSYETERGMGTKYWIVGPAIEMVEKYLNQIGSKGWEIVNIDFVDKLRSHFVGLAKREMD